MAPASVCVAMRRVAAGLAACAVALMVVSCSSPSKTETDPIKTIAAGGFLYVYADDKIDSIYVNGAVQALDSALYQPGNIIKIPFGPYTGSKVTLGIVGNNSGNWSGSVMAALVTADNQYYSTDATWKCSFAPEAGWGATGFNDAAWYPVGDNGTAEQTVYWQRDSSCMAGSPDCPYLTFKNASARALWTPKKTYFRTVFTSATAKTAYMKVASPGGIYTVYLNGTMVDTGSGSQAEMDSVPVNLVAGNNVFAAVVVDTSTTINGAGIKFGGAIVSDSSWSTTDSAFLDFMLPDPFNPTHADSIDPANWDISTTVNYIYTTHVKSDTGWHFSIKEEAGYQSASFTEGASWQVPGSYESKFVPPLAGGPTTVTKPLCTWVWSPKIAYFRKDFAIK